jgi:hypothetical protein
VGLNPRMPSLTGLPGLVTRAGTGPDPLRDAGSTPTMARILARTGGNPGFGLPPPTPKTFPMAPTIPPSFPPRPGSPRRGRFDRTSRGPARPPQRRRPLPVAGLAVLLLTALVTGLAGSIRAATPTGPLPSTRPAAAASVPAYWLVAADGGIFSFGGLPFYGSMGNKPLWAPVVGMASTPDHHGYWEVASDGGIFSFGDARFHGSMGGRPLDRPVVTAASTADGGGYWEVASDGGVFTFGDARFLGSLGALDLSHPEVAMAPTGAPDNGGYWMTDSNGAVASFGNAVYEGSAPQNLHAPVVGVADAPGTGAIGNTLYPHGATGPDVSNFQCGDALPGHTVGVVEVNGWSLSAPNPCLSTEAAWAGAGLNLYTFLSYGADGAHPQPGCASAQCNFGYEAAQYAVDTARARGVETAVGWWVDVAPSNWSGNQGANAQVVAGALMALRSDGINSAGIYASPGTFPSIVGSYRPAVPVWAAWWTGNGAFNCANVRGAFPGALPTGPVLLTQYTDNVSYGGHTFDADYAC